MRLIRLLKQDLAREARDWVEEKIITVDQAATICRRYGIDYANPEGRSLGYFVLMGLGFLFIGLAVITLLGANWDDIPRAVRMAGLIGITLVANIVGIYKYRAGERHAAIGAFFLGAMFYGASIMLIAQIYHIGEHFPDGIFWWALGVLPAALLLDSVLLMILATSLGFIWFFVETGLWFYPTLFPVFIAALAWQTVRGRQSNLLFLALLAAAGLWAEYTLAWWLQGDRYYFYFGPEGVALGVGLFLVLCTLGKWLLSRDDHRWQDYGTLVNLWTLRFTLVFLLVMSFQEPWRELIRYEWRLGGGMVAIAAGLGAIAVGLAYAARERLAPVIAFAGFYLAGLAGVMLIDDRKYALGLQVIDNLALVATGIWLIARGIRGGISHYFYLGVTAVLVTGLLRYIDLVGDYIGATVLFMVFAIILLSAARYWRRQQQGGQPA